MQHIRETNRDQTDVTDKEWRVIEPHLPAAKSTGRPRAWPMREIINGIFYVMRAGCPWRLLPSDLPPWSTICRWFATFRDESRFEKINHALVMLDRERVGRQASPTGAIIDSQSIKTTDALACHGKPDIFNTDQGSQFTGAAFTGVLIKNGIAISNVFVERLWRSVKYEEVYLNAYDSVSEARASIGRYLDFYNGRRPHSSLDGMTPNRAYFTLLPLRLAA
jgi:transposase